MAKKDSSSRSYEKKRKRKSRPERSTAADDATATANVLNEAMAPSQAFGSELLMASFSLCLAAQNATTQQLGAATVVNASTALAVATIYSSLPRPLNGRGR